MFMRGFPNDSVRDLSDGLAETIEEAETATHTKQLVKIAEESPFGVVFQEKDEDA